MMSLSVPPPPSILVVVPGHGEPVRSHVTIANLARIARMHVRISHVSNIYHDFLCCCQEVERAEKCTPQQQPKDHEPPMRVGG